MSIRIVLTGGPGAGKTVIATRLSQMYPERYVAVPEAATQVYALLQTRWDRLDAEARRDVQRRIYRLQIDQEQRFAQAHPRRILLVDRGTVDGAAYWPDGPDTYWNDVGSSHELELSRYRMVIWMESCAAVGLYDGAASNVFRHEDAQTAIASGQAVLSLWRGHPNLKHVGAFAGLDDKIAAVEELLATVSADESRQ